VTKPPGLEPVLTDPELPLAEADPPVPADSARPEKALLRRVAGYAVSRGASEGLLALRGVLLATVLGPAAFGSWALLRLTTRYSALAGLAIFRGLEVELLHPAEGHGERLGSRASSTALGFILLVTGTLASLALAASAMVPDASHRLLLRAFAAAALAEGLYNYVLVFTRVRTSLRRYAILEAATAALHLALGVTLARIWGLPGALAGLALASATGSVIASRWVELRPAVDLQALTRMLSIGVPLAVTGCVGTALQTADRWVVAAWGGATMLGYYAFAAAVAGAAGALALVIRTVVFPQVYGDARSAGPAAALRAHLEGTLLPYARLFPPVLGAMGLVLGPVLAVVLPGYQEAVAPARLFLLGGAAIGVVNLAAVGAVAAGRQRHLPGYAAAALALNLGLSLTALSTGGGLEAVAGASLAGHLLFAATVLRLNVRESGIEDAGRFVARALLPLVWCAAAVMAAARLSPPAGPASGAGALGIYFGLLLPFLPMVRREWRRVRG
jgi:O-antigen/teichoic acid export membrane protein